MSALDILPDHPDRDRYVPHPLKVTVPAVAVMTDAGPIGLLWDAPTGQDSYEAAGPLALVFATPNRFEGHGNHLMGLQLPAPGWGVQENSRRASEPIALAAGRARHRLRDTHRPRQARLLSVVERWYERGFGPCPTLAAQPRMRSASAWGVSSQSKLWNPEWSNWYPISSSASGPLSSGAVLSLGLRDPWRRPHRRAFRRVGCSGAPDA